MGGMGGRFLPCRFARQLGHGSLGDGKGLVQVKWVCERERLMGGGDGLVRQRQ